MTPDEARRLMHEWTASEALRGHMEAVAACMGAYADKLGADNPDDWVVAGLLHDFDYEKHPSKEEHPFVGVRELESRQVDRDILDAILGHANYSGVPRQTPIARALFAVDELAGFIVACAKVRPTGIEGMQAKSVRKKLKDRAFAAAVSREDIAVGIEEVKAIDTSIEEGGHIQTCIDAIAGAVDRIPI
ncbi:MAG: HD domain-containing protein [Phycisphaeraceae bacterium]|nr:HD domain-containing protein [Phycisphaeraceae bacterium]MCB9847921.1 HD domain-containing protein [Phycisphaeraceae bacterium]